MDQQILQGKAEYAWTKKNGKPFIKATSNNAASGLIYSIGDAPQKHPYIIWFWKVDNFIFSGDATQKSRDDYIARIYIAFPSLFFRDSKIINYIWANKLPQNKVIPSPYTPDSIMISVESGTVNTGKWTTETRNPFEDFIRFVGKKRQRLPPVKL